MTCLSHAHGLSFSCVGGDAHIAPANRTDFTEISGESDSSPRVDVGIDPYEPRRKLSARTERFGIYDRKMPYIFSGALKPSRSMHVSSTRRVRSISAT